jgi:hypothetical protein
MPPSPSRIPHLLSKLKWSVRRRRGHQAQWVPSGTVASDLPVLFVDVDGVISLFGFPSESSEMPGPLHWIEGVAHCIPLAAGGRLVRLAERFELVWATGWEHKANEHLPLLMQLPFGELPCLTFGGRAVFGSSHWKLGAMSAYAGNRPAAWIDDNLDDACRLWARERPAPTLLVQSHASVGMTDEHVEKLLSWADEVAPRAERAGSTEAA